MDVTASPSGHGHHAGPTYVFAVFSCWFVWVWENRGNEVLRPFLKVPACGEAVHSSQDRNGLTQKEYVKAKMQVEAKPIGSRWR